MYDFHHASRYDRLIAWAIGLLTLLVYLITLAPGAYPGESAAMMASLVGLSSNAEPSHPLGSLLFRLIALPGLPGLPLRLNMLSALCGAAAIGLLYRLVSRWLLRAARISSDSGNHEIMPPEDDPEDAPREVPRAVSPWIITHRSRVAAVTGGLTAAAVFAFCVPFWSASTRLHFETLDVLLLLLAVERLMLYLSSGRQANLLSSAFLWGMGIVEAPVFVLAAPLVIFGLVTTVRDHTKDPAPALLLTTVAILSGIGASLTLAIGLSYVTATGSPAAALGALLRANGRAITDAWSNAGGVSTLFQILIPAGLALTITRYGISNRSPSLSLVHLLLLAVTVECLLGAPIAPWRQMRLHGHLPVMSYLLLALTAGYLAARGWACAGADVNMESTGDDTHFERGLSALSCYALVGVAGLTLALNLSEANGRAGAFVDALARETLTQCNGRTWLVAEREFAPHLAVVAHEQRLPVRILAATGRAPTQLASWIDADPGLASNRGRLMTAAATGADAFVATWFRIDDRIEQRAAVATSTDLWAVAGRHAVPCLLLDLGATNARSIPAGTLLASHRDGWGRINRLLPAAHELPPMLVARRDALGRQVARVANELGVALEDQGDAVGAYDAYAQARRSDTMNVSAVLNQYGLIKQGLHAGERETINAAVRAPFVQAALAHDVNDLARNQGPLRSTTHYRRLRLNLSLAAQPPAARAMLQQLQEYDVVHATSPDELIRLALAPTPTNTATAGAVAADLLRREAAVMIMSGQAGAAARRLTAALTHTPDDLRLWALLAGALFQEGSDRAVEVQVLPGLRAAAGTRDLPLMHVMRAHLSLRGGPSQYNTACQALRAALALQPDLPGVSDTLLRLDLLQMDWTALESDATAALAAQPASAFASYLLGDILIGQGRLDQAEEQLRRSLALQPTALVWCRLAEIHRQRPSLQAAEDAARQALAIDDDSHEPWEVLGCILMDAKRFAEAEDALAQALRRCEDAPCLAIKRARLLAARGDIRTARQVASLNRSAWLKLPPRLRVGADALESQLAANAQ